MAPLLRKRLVCFYCNARSGIRKDGLVREWLCKQCDAMNYLDENGDIADYVPPSPAERVQYARPGVSSQSNANAFCSTCIQNQRLINENLAAYLPSPSHPDYAKYEAGYPRYREDLEDRYPPVCVNCEEGVMKRIRSAEYMASTDFLRRKLEQTKSGVKRQHDQDQGWRRLVIFLGGVLYMTSLLLEIPWHVYGSMSQQQNDEDGLRSEKASLTIKTFGQQCLQLSSFDESCQSLAAEFAGKGLILAVMSVWWNNQLWQKTLRGYNKLDGLNEYYKLQMVILGARFGAYLVLHHELVSIPEQVVQRASHIFMLVFLVLSTIISLRTVTVSHAPRISFHRKTSPLAPRTKNPLPTLPPRTQQTYPTPSNSQSNNFGLPSLPPVTPQRQIAVYQTPATQRSIYHTPSNLIPPSPPASEPDVDAMDWTPSQPSQQLILNPTTPTPYTQFNALSPAQQQNSPSYRRKPSNNTTTTDGQSTVHENNDDGSDSDSSTHLRRGHKRKQQQQPPQPARFLLNDEHNLHTGLENLFDRVFTLRDEPPEVLLATGGTSTTGRAAAASHQQGRGRGRRISTAGGTSTQSTPSGGAWELWKDRLATFAFAAPILVVLYWFLGGLGRLIVAKLARDAAFALR